MMGGFIPLIVVTAAGRVSWSGGNARAALGKGGVTATKREGDGATPSGIFPLRSLWYRADRVAPPMTGLDRFRIETHSGWSDDPADRAYNRAVTLPHAARHEDLWRADGLYDLLVPLGYNDDPPIPGLGSAIFLHCAKPDYAPTQGCVALALGDLMVLLPHCGRDSHILIEA